MTTAPQVLSVQLLPRTRLMTAVWVIGFAGLTALSAQIRIPLPFTPVPITGQTFAVLLSGAVLGWMAGGSSQILYLAMGAVGWPVFAGGSGSWEIVTGATGGYLIGFILAAMLVGWLAEQRQDRHFLTTVTAFGVGTLVIYFCGVTGLLLSTEMNLTAAIANGVAPFIVGDLVKAGAAGLLLPTAWKLSANQGKQDLDAYSGI